MKLRRIFLVVSMLLMLASTAAVAGDYAWMPDFNRRADANPTEFRARLAARFRIGDVQIDAVLTNVKRPADAYMVFRLGEMSHHPADYVLERYKSNRGRGWGALAKSLGIKPGSPEFHALKRGHDLYYDGNEGKVKGEGKKAKVKNRE